MHGDTCLWHLPEWSFPPLFWIPSMHWDLLSTPFPGILCECPSCMGTFWAPPFWVPPALASPGHPLARHSLHGHPQELSLDPQVLTGPLFLGSSLGTPLLLKLPLGCPLASPVQLVPPILALCPHPHLSSPPWAAWAGLGGSAAPSWGVSHPAPLPEPQRKGF